MSADKCPNCGEKYPEHTSWSGGNGILIIGCRCKKCGHSWDSESKVKKENE